MNVFPVWNRLILTENYLVSVTYQIFIQGNLIT